MRQRGERRAGRSPSQSGLRGDCHHGLIKFFRPNKHLCATSNVDLKHRDMAAERQTRLSIGPPKVFVVIGRFAVVKTLAKCRIP